MRSSVIGGVGYWDPTGHWRAYGSGYRELEWRSELWSMVGLGRRWSLYGRLPWILGYRHVGNLGGNVDGGLADVQAGARYELLGIGEYLRLPAVALGCGLTLPTGRTVEAADLGGSGVTSRGVWVVSAAATVEKTYLPWFVRLTVGLNAPVARRQDSGKSQRYGLGVQSDLAGGRELLRDLVLSVTARFLWEDAIRLDGAQVPDSRRSDLGLGVALSWRFDPHWTAQTAFDTGVFASGLGDNTPGRLTATVGVRYGYF
ncbi:MAG: hypothetical protein IPL40_12630 [Proteobacteria bacterium]|nr:hypothetical protein [Pseudomonadota bacterium]